jgi:hypothetical protein
MAVWRQVLVLVGAAALVGCGGGGDDAVRTPRGTTPRTEGHDVVFTAPPAITTTTTSTTTTLPPPTGLPETFPVPDNGILSLSGSSTMSQGLEIRAVPVNEIHDWLVEGLQAAGYDVVSDAPTVVEFVGRNVAGRAKITGTADPIDVTILLGAPT